MKSPFLYPTHAGLRHLLNCPALLKLPAESPAPLKKLPAFLPLLLGLLLLLGGCKDLFGIKEDPVPVPPPSLPPATQIGANTFGCYVNGNLWLPYGSGLNFPLSADYDYNNKELTIGASARKPFNIVEGFIFRIKNISDILSSQDTFSLNDGIGVDAYGSFTIYTDNGDITYKTTSSIGGNIILSHFNNGGGIVSGLFSFKAINSSGDTITVESGRFDLKTHY